MSLSTQDRYPLQARTMQGIESSCPLLKKQIKNKYFSCPLFLTATKIQTKIENLAE